MAIKHDLQDLLKFQQTAAYNLAVSSNLVRRQIEYPGFLADLNSLTNKYNIPSCDLKL